MLLVLPCFDERLDGERDQGQERQQRRAGEGRSEGVFVVEDFDMQRQCVGRAAYVA